MGKTRQSLLADEPSTAITMKVLLLLALVVCQITGQDDGHGGMGGSGMEGSGSGYGMGGYGYGMGGSGYGGEWSEWMPTGGYGGGECCPTKKIWGSMNPEKDGFYDLVMGSGMGGGYGYGMGKDDKMWPERCKSFCVYKKRNTSDDRLHCFARSSNSQSMCMREDGDSYR